MRTTFTSIIMLIISLSGFADEQLIEGMIVTGIEQSIDDEEAPFDILAGNKIHKCGGQASNRFRIHSEYENVAMRRFMMAMTAMEKKWHLYAKSKGCEGGAMTLYELGIKP